jgi:thiosulfate reductase cytochrome b subunit
MRALEPHSALVRVTHWVNALSFAALLVSGVAILLAHPRLYWGETGAFGAPSLIDLPLPLVLTGQSGWGRSLHFLSAWVCVIARHRATCSPRGCARRHVRRISAAPRVTATPAQRLAYFAVVILLVPAMIWTGLAMSPAVTSMAPLLVNVVGGQQSARTIHFAIACALVLFLAGHVTMVALSGFRVRMRGMITGRRAMGAGRA